jgi:hypothetical protein
MASDRRYWAGLVGLLLILLSATARAQPQQPDAGTSYYVSSTHGNDSAAGTSPDQAWRTLARASAQPLEPGDAVLLRAGDRFAGQLALQSSGKPGQPLRIASYGAGPKPVIDGASAPDGGFSETILIRNQQHIEISDLELTNTLDLPRAGQRGDWSFGIHVINDGAGVLEHFRFRRLTITNVFAAQLDHASEDAFNRVPVSGIRFAVAAVPAGAEPSFFRDIVIIDNDISRTGRFGVQISHAGGGDAHTRDPETGFNRDIIIKDNRFVELGGTAVQLAGARFALIENNDFDRTGSSVVPSRMVGRGSGAWVINSRDIVAQRNQSRHVRGYKDSYGLHVDYGNRDVLYQYNLSYDSEGGFVEILGNNRNIIWRYNISINDGLREKDGNTIWLSPWSTDMTLSEGIHIYNNTVFVRAGMYPDLDFRARGARIWNNIFAVSRHGMIGEKYRAVLGGGRLELAGNLYFGRISPKLRGLDASSVEGDPQFADPGVQDPEGYMIGADSPAAGRGVLLPHPDFPGAGQGIFAHISEQPEVDFFGQPLPQGVAPTIGAALPAPR